LEVNSRNNLLHSRSYQDQVESATVHLEISGEAILPETIALKSVFLKSLSMGTRVILHIDNLLTVDISFLQLLIAFVRQAREKNIELVLEGKKLPVAVQCAFQKIGAIHEDEEIKRYLGVQF